MVKDKTTLNRFYKRLAGREKISYHKAVAIYEALYREAVSLGVIPAHNRLEGLEVNIRMAKIIHGLKP